VPQGDTISRLGNLPVVGGIFRAAQTAEDVNETLERVGAPLGMSAAGVVRLILFASLLGAGLSIFLLLRGRR